MGLDLNLKHLSHLESEAIYVLREVGAQFINPALLFSGGKDSIVVFHLAQKAFFPAKVPFPLVHIDTGHNFRETIEFRDRLVKKYNATLVVGSVQQSIDDGLVRDTKGSRNRLQSVTLMQLVNQNGYDALVGGARRDEEKARAKERFFSRRDASGRWDPTQQQAEPWMILNGMSKPGEHYRVFPLNNWTELDIWLYIKRENIEVPSLYFSHQRYVASVNGVLLATDDQASDSAATQKCIRFRTIGDKTCTGAIESTACSVDDIIRETLGYKSSERGTRADDHFSATAMEERKREGYF